MTTGATNGYGKKEDGARSQPGPHRVAGGQDYEVRYQSKKEHRSKASVRKAVKKVGNSRKRVERALSRKKT